VPLGEDRRGAPHIASTPTICLSRSTLTLTAKAAKSSCFTGAVRRLLPQHVSSELLIVRSGPRAGTGHLPDDIRAERPPIRVPRQGEGRLLAHHRRGLKESAWITIIIVSTRARVFHEDVWTLPVRPSPLRKRFRVDPRCLAEPARTWRRQGRLLFSAKPRQFDEAPHQVLFQAGRQMLATEPPSTRRLVPVMNDAASEAR
jgi:hypothetical protein